MSSATEARERTRSSTTDRNLARVVRQLRTIHIAITATTSATNTKAPTR
jgi:hypothetical protein